MQPNDVCELDCTYDWKLIDIFHVNFNKLMSWISNKPQIVIISIT